MARRIQMVVSLDRGQMDWLRQKEEVGYSRPGLVRYAVKRLMVDYNANTEMPLPAKQAEPKPAEVQEEPYKRYELDKILEAMLTVSDDLVKVYPNAVSTIKDIQDKLKNIDYLHPRIAFELGKSKVELEELFSRKLAESEKASKARQ